MRAQALFWEMLEYIKNTWPHWGRSNGADHILVMGGKWGACELFDGDVPGEILDAILLRCAPLRPSAIGRPRQHPSH